MTKEELRQHLLAAPTGTDPVEIVNALRAKGVQMEGDPLATYSTVIPGASPVAKASIGGGLYNVANSAFQFLAQPVLHPVKTFQTLTAPIEAGVGAIEKGINSLTGRNDFQGDPAMQNFDRNVETTKQLAKNIAETPYRATTPIRAGVATIEKGINAVTGRNDFQNDPAMQSFHQDVKTLYENPAGVAADIAMVTPLAGAALSKLGGGSAISDIGQTVSKGGQMIDPARIPEMITKPIAGKLRSAAEGQYQSALKPTKAVREEFPNVVTTGLENRVIVSKGGLAEVKQSLSDIRDQTDQIIEDAANSGKTVGREAAVAYAQRARDYFKNTVGGSKYADQLDSLIETFRNEQPTQIPVNVAQQLKKNTGKLINNAYGELGTAVTEGTKDIVRGLKDGLAEAIPELKTLNPKQQKFIGLEKALEDFVGRRGNLENIGLTPGIFGAVGGTVRGILSGVVKGKLLKAAFDDPAVKSSIAIILDRASQAVSKAGAMQKAAKAAARASHLSNPGK